MKLNGLHWNLTLPETKSPTAPKKLQKETRNFQPSIFRCELLVCVRVTQFLFTTWGLWMVNQNHVKGFESARIDILAATFMCCFFRLFCVVLVQPIKGWVESFWKKFATKVLLGAKAKAVVIEVSICESNSLVNQFFRKSVPPSNACMHWMQPTRPKKTGWQKTDPGRLSPARLFFERQLRPETRNYSEMVGSDSWWLRKGCEDLWAKHENSCLRATAFTLCRGWGFWHKNSRVRDAIYFVQVFFLEN